VRLKRGDSYGHSHGHHGHDDHGHHGGGYGWGYLGPVHTYAVSAASILHLTFNYMAKLLKNI